MLKEVSAQDLMKFGLIPEFIGRVPITVTLDGLDQEALVRILKELHPFDLFKTKSTDNKRRLCFGDVFSLHHFH